MKLRRYISMLMLAAYLLAVGGVSWSVMACPCISQQETSRCLFCVQHDEEYPHDSTHLHIDQGDCCGHDHDGRSELYTFTDSHRENLRPVVAVDLIQAFVPAADADMHLAVRSYQRTVHPVKPYDDPTLSAAGLRDPPVQA